MARHLLKRGAACAREGSRSHRRICLRRGLPLQPYKLSLHVPHLGPRSRALSRRQAGFWAWGITPQSTETAGPHGRDAERDGMRRRGQATRALQEETECRDPNDKKKPREDPRRAVRRQHGQTPPSAALPPVPGVGILSAARPGIRSPLHVTSSEDWMAPARGRHGGGPMTSEGKEI